MRHPNIVAINISNFFQMSYNSHEIYGASLMFHVVWPNFLLLNQTNPLQQYSQLWNHFHKWCLYFFAVCTAFPPPFWNEKKYQMTRASNKVKMEKDVSFSIFTFNIKRFKTHNYTQIIQKADKMLPFRICMSNFNHMWNGRLCSNVMYWKCYKFVSSPPPQILSL